MMLGARSGPRIAVVVALLVLVVSAGEERSHDLSVVAVAAADRGNQSETIMCDTQNGPSQGARWAPIGHVLLYFGSYTIDAVDIGGTTPLAQTFTRAYTSLDARVTHLGPGWTDNFDVRLRTDGVSRDVLFTLPSGSVEVFKNGLDADRSFGTSRGYRVLTRSSVGSVISDDGTTWTFDQGGSLVEVDNGTGDWAKIRYEVGHPSDPAGASGPAGEGIRLEMGEPGRFARVTDQADPTRFVSYGFDALGRLIRVAPSSSATQRYAYEGTSQRISTVSDDSGHVLFSVDYDGAGRVAREQDAQGLIDGQAVVYVYEDLPDGGKRTTVTYPTSVVEPGWHPVQIAVHDSEGRVTEDTRKPTSKLTLIGRYAWDSENRKIALDPPCDLTPVAGTPPAAGPLVWIVGFFESLVSLVFNLLPPVR
jgi:hypothetical protein